MVDEGAQVRRVDQIETVVIPDRAPRAIDIRHVEIRLIGPAIAVRVAQPDDGTAQGIAVERTILVAGNEQRAVRRGGHIDRVIGRWRGGEDIDIEARWNLHIGKHGAIVRSRGRRGNDFRFRAMDRHFPEAAPATGVGAEEGDADEADPVRFAA